MLTDGRLPPFARRRCCLFWGESQRRSRGFLPGSVRNLCSDLHVQTQTVNIAGDAVKRRNISFTFSPGGCLESLSQAKERQQQQSEDTLMKKKKTKKTLSSLPERFSLDEIAPQLVLVLLLMGNCGQPDVFLCFLLLLEGLASLASSVSSVFLLMCP